MSEKPTDEPKERGHLNLVVIPALVGLFLVLKLLIASHQTDTLYLSAAWLWGSAACTLLAISPLPLFPGRLRVLAACSLSLLVDFVYLSDLAYYRYFTDLPSAAQLYQSGQLKKVGDSVASLFRLSDLILLVDIPVYVFLLRKTSASRPLKHRSLLAAGLLAAGLAGLWLAESSKTPIQRGVEERRFKNYALGREFGLPLYHLSDLKNQLKLNWERRSKPQELDPFLVPVQRAVQSIKASSPYRGAGKDLNVLVILLETWQGFSLNLEVDGQPVMPYLSSFKDQCLYFRNVYDQTNHAPSADGEFILANSLHPTASGATSFVHQNNSYYSLPTILTQAGYTTSYFGYYDGGFWNARVMNEKYGMQNLYFAPFGPPPTAPEKIGWGLADYPLLKRVQDELLSQSKPFYCVVQASMGHHPFQELQPQQKWLQLNPQLKGTVLGDFLQTCRFRDRNLELFLEEFKQSEMSQNTILVFTGDHSSAMTPEDLKPLYANSPLPAKAEWAKRQTVPMLVYIPGLEGREFPEPIGQIDIAPTLLHLLGVTPDRPIFFGQNALAREGPVFFRRAACALHKEILVSVLDKKAYNLSTRETLPFEDYQELAEQAFSEWQLSDQLLFFDLIPDLRESEVGRPSP